MAARVTPDQIIAKLKAGERHDLVILAIPSHDRDNKPLNNQPEWARDALDLFSELFGGATAFETFAGIYRSETGDNLLDKPILIEAYSERTDVESRTNLEQLLQFIRRMKVAMRQETVMLVIDEYRWFLG